MPPSSQRVWMKPGHTVLTRAAGENQPAPDQRGKARGVQPVAHKLQNLLDARANDAGEPGARNMYRTGVLVVLADR